VSSPVSAKVTRHGSAHIVGKVLLDHISLVTQADHEVGDAVMGIDLHDMPQDRFTADLHHRLGMKSGLLGDAGAVAAGQDYRFHVRLR
jgi:hypothetical protein